MKKVLKKYSLIITMVSLVLIASSSIIYARFSRQYNPEVKSFGISVASQDSMLISTSGNRGTFFDHVRYEELMNDQDITLYPIIGKKTITADETFEVLEFSDDLGHSVNPALTFDLYFIASKDMNLYLKGSTQGEVIVIEEGTTGEQFTNEQKNNLIKNLRIGFMTYSTAYQGSYPMYSEYPVSTNIYSVNKEETDNYTTFADLGYTNTNKDTILAATKKNEVTKMKVVVWLEKDTLADSVAICNLTLALRFHAEPTNN